MQIQFENLPPVIDRFRGEFNFLSNMHAVEPSGIEVIDNRQRFKVPTSEHIYAAGKLASFEARRYIYDAHTGLKARDRARDLIKNRGFETAYEGETAKIENMRRALQLKFAAGTRMSAMLLATGDSVLVEGNDWDDNFWGCDPPDCSQGQNNLGILLMEQRDALAVDNQ